MRNILSYHRPAYFRGGEIKRWCWYNINKHTSHEKMAWKIISRYSTLDNDGLYEIIIWTEKKRGKRVKVVRITE